MSARTVRVTIRGDIMRARGADDAYAAALSVGTRRAALELAHYVAGAAGELMRLSAGRYARAAVAYIRARLETLVVVALVAATVVGIFWAVPADAMPAPDFHAPASILEPYGGCDEAWQAPDSPAARECARIYGPFGGAR